VWGGALGSGVINRADEDVGIVFVGFMYLKEIEV
jgi:hypothetical protein